MRLAPALLAVAGIAAAIVLIRSGGEGLLSPPPVVEEMPRPDMQVPAPPPVAQSPDGPPPPAPAPQIAERAPRGPRAIAPEAVAPPPLLFEELEREEPRQPLTPLGQPIVRQRDPVTLLHRPLADTAGRFTSGGVTVTVAGIRIPAPDETCTDSAGRQWACGVRARTAFRSFLRGRAVECDLPPDMAVREATVACRLGKQDLGAWLVAGGWAHALEEGPYAEQAGAARRERRGLFADAPATPQPSGESAAPSEPSYGGLLAPPPPSSILAEPPPDEPDPAL